MNQSHLYIGLMSGTSADAIDAALVDFSARPQLIASQSFPLSESLRKLIFALCNPENDSLDLMGSLDRELGIAFADSVNAILKKANLAPAEIKAIGSHGQTIRHRPPGTWTQGKPFSLQIGDPNTIALQTGIVTVADFRRKDIAAGGQGAPLVPAFHKALFHHPERNRALVNIGGMANITWIPAAGSVVGYDTGPGNVLMDAWIYRHKGVAFDQDGAWAASAEAPPDLVEQLYDHPYFALPHPKSTGREVFNQQWLEVSLQRQDKDYAPATVQSSLLQLTVTSIAEEISRLGKADEVILCGGGAYNLELKRRLAQAIPDSEILTTQDLGIAPQWIEAMAFAWLAKQTMNHLPGNLREVTGAAKEVILGGIYLPG